MSGDNRHIIRTLRFDADALTEELANAFTEKVRTINYESILSKVLSRYDQIHETISIDSLTLDMGYVDTEDLVLLEEEIRTQLEQLFYDELTTTNQHVGNRKKMGSQHGSIFLNTLETKVGLLMHYLFTGSLPWNIVDRPDIESLFIEIAGQDIEKLKKVLLPEMGKKLVTKRMSVIFSMSTIEMLIDKIVGAESINIVNKIKDILKKEPYLQQLEVERELSLICLTTLYEVEIRHKAFNIAFIQQLQNILYKYPISSLQAISKSVQHLVTLSTNSPDQESYKSLLEIINQQTRTIEVDYRVQDTRLPDNNSENIKVQSSATEERTKVEDLTQDTLTEIHLDQYFIDNAGLVLLNASLLHKYFEQLCWVKDKIIVDEASRHKIMIWLDYIVWGERKIHEYGLMLHKILVGLHPSDICDIHTTLEKKEISVADEFLETIIHHWSILKNTSIEGLRTAFLQRTGRLNNEDGGWQLHIASKGYDILIDSLPWSHSIIKFPWMEKPLFTQWQSRI